MSDIERDDDGNVTIKPPTASANGGAIAPGVTLEAGPPEFIVYMHEGRPVLYQRYVEE